MEQAGRLQYDLPRPGDFDDYYRIYSDPQTNLFNPKGPVKAEEAHDRFNLFIQHWADHHFGTWTIRETGSQRIIGFGGLSYRLYGEELKLNLGYRFGTDAWGKGFATELSKHSIDYGFTELKVDKIFAIVRPQHNVSVKVLEKAGMTLAGTLDDVPGEAESLVYIVEKKSILDL
ncbi:MAG: family N-acetyltransferase [Ferruginibacter sp.]|nr:family N-acetyltransferase [Ferruginibacter sp.]